MRRVILLAGCFFFLGGSGAEGQQFRGLGLLICEATATPAQVGDVGTTDTLGDIVVTCINSLPDPIIGPAVSEVAVTVSVSTGPANANTIDLSTGSPVTDAVLTVNENECASPSAVGASFGNCGAPDERFQDPQFGILTESNRIQWTNVRFPVPGATAGGPVLGHDCSDGTCFPEKTVLRLSGIRSLIDFRKISAFISIQGGPAISVANNVVNVGESSGPKPIYGNPSPLEMGTVTCTTSTVPAAVDPAGTNEPVGAILLECRLLAPPGGIAGPTHLTFDAVVGLTTDFAGPTTPGPNGPPLTAATLTVDADEAGATPGELEASNRIRFRGVTIPFAPEDHERIFRIAIEGMRSNVAQLKVPDMATFPSTQVTATISVGGAELPMTRNTVNVGTPIGPSAAATKDLPIPLACEATSVPPATRAEAIADAGGDITLVCTRAGLPEPTVSSFLADISVSVHSSLTNNVGFLTGNITDAVLVVNGNHCSSPSATGGTFGSCGAPDSRFQDPQFGRLTAPNRITWENVEIPVPWDVPFVGDSMPFPGMTTITIRGVRGFDARSPIPPTSTFPQILFTGYLSVAKTESLALKENVLDLSVPIRGLRPKVPAAPIASRSCVAGAAPMPIRLSEGFATAFRTQGVPTARQIFGDRESGYFAPGSNNGGGASQGTRVLFQFNDVPRGVVIQAPKHLDLGDLSVNGDATELRLLEGTDVRGAGGTPTVGEGFQAIPIEDGGGIAVYEFVDASQFLLEQIDVPFQVSWAGKSGGLLTRAGQATVRALLAPLSDVTVASGPEPEPRFLDPGDPGEVFLSLDGAGCFPGAYLGAFTDGLWFRDRNGDGAFDPATEITGWGSPGDTPVDGDWNGDGFRDVGVFSGGTWFIDVNGDGAFDPAAEIKGWGVAGWTPVIGDWNGDGVTDLGAIDPSTMSWFRDLNGDFLFDPATEVVGWGSPGDTPVVGDWNGDGADEIGVFSGGLWFLDLDGSGSFDPATEVVGWGVAGWTPIVGDWDGDGDDDLGAIDPAAMAWFRDVNGDFLFDPATELVGWGSPGAVPVTGDWNSDGADEIGVFSDGTWFLDANGDDVFDPATEIRGWGAAGWTPVAGPWQ